VTARPKSVCIGPLHWATLLSRKGRVCERTKITQIRLGRIAIEKLGGSHIESGVADRSSLRRRASREEADSAPRSIAYSARSGDVNLSDLVLDGSKKAMQIGPGDVQAAGGKGLVAVTFLDGRGCELQLEIPQQPLE
jgi:hypothetical protein